jgi:hypothetical protein
MHDRRMRRIVERARQAGVSLKYLPANYPQPLSALTKAVGAAPIEGAEKCTMDAQQLVDKSEIHRKIKNF